MLVKADLAADFSRLVKIIQAQTVNKVSKKVNLNFAPKDDPNYIENGRYCRTLNPDLKQTSTGLLTCLGAFTYSIKNKNYEYIYVSNADSTKLAQVKLISSTSYPIAKYTYSYPDGVLKSTVVDLSADKKMLFNPDGSLKLYASPKICVEGKKGAMNPINYAYQLCKKYLEQEEESLNSRYNKK